MSSSSVNLTMSKNFCKCHNVPQVQQKIKEKKKYKNRDRFKRPIIQHDEQS
jgi:hypothetical protein